MKNKSKTLYFEGAGWPDTQRNDVENCRIRTAFTNKNNQKIYLELGSGGGINEGLAFIDYCHYITNNKDDCNNSKVENINRGKIGKYTKDNILQFVNDNLNCNFDKLEILPSEVYYVHDKSENGHNKYTLIDDLIISE